MSLTKKWGRQYRYGDIKGYEDLAQILQMAYFRAAKTKGIERHARTGQTFREQEICADLREFGITPALFQARKKIKESARLHELAAVNELLDAIVYLAAAVIVSLEDEKTIADFSFHIGEDITCQMLKK